MDLPFQISVQRRAVILILRIRQVERIMMVREVLDTAQQSDIIRRYAWRNDFAIIIPAPDWEPIEVKIELEALLKKRLGFDA